MTDDAGKGAVGARPAAPGREVALRPNPRSKLRCECGSGKPTVWQIVVDHVRKIDCCYACHEQRWAEERLFDPDDLVRVRGRTE